MQTHLRVKLVLQLRDRIKAEKQREWDEASSHSLLAIMTALERNLQRLSKEAGTEGNTSSQVRTDIFFSPHCAILNHPSPPDSATADYVRTCWGKNKIKNADARVMSRVSVGECPRC